MALELPRSCITDSACFSSSSRFIVLWRHGEQSRGQNRADGEQAENVKTDVSVWRLEASYLLPVETRRYSAVLRVRLVDLRVGVQQTLHGSVTVERRHVEQHLPGVEGEEERAAGGDREHC